MNQRLFKKKIKILTPVKSILLKEVPKINIINIKYKFFEYFF